MHLHRFTHTIGRGLFVGVCAKKWEEGWNKSIMSVLHKMNSFVLLFELAKILINPVICYPPIAFNLPGFPEIKIKSFPRAIHTYYWWECLYLRSGAVIKYHEASSLYNTYFLIVLEDEFRGQHANVISFFPLKCV